MIIGRKDRQRVAELEKKVNILSVEALANETAMGYLQALIDEDEEEIRHLKEINRKKDKVIHELERKDAQYEMNDKDVYSEQAEKLPAAQNAALVLNINDELIN